MRFIPTAILVTLIAHPVLAQGPLLYDGFDYTIGENLSNQTHVATGNQWLRPTSPAGATHTIDVSNVPYTGLAATTGNGLAVPRPNASSNTENRIDIPGRPYTRADGDTVFFSFTLQITSFSNFAAVGSDTKNDAAAKNPTHRKGGFIGGFHGGQASTSTAMSLAGGFAAPVFFRRELDMSQMGTDGTPGTQTGRFEIGIMKQAGAPADPADLEASFDTNNSYGVGDVLFVIGQYDFNDPEQNGTGDTARLWVNPTPGNLSAENTPTITAPAALLNIQGALNIESFHIRGDTNTPGGLLMDEVRVGTTFADVMPAAPAGGDGDFDLDGDTDGNDFLFWQRGSSPNPLSPGDLAEWEGNFGSATVVVGAIPEPSAIALFAAAGIGLIAYRRRLTTSLT